MQLSGQTNLFIHVFPKYPRWKCIEGPYSVRQEILIITICYFKTYLYPFHNNHIFCSTSQMLVLLPLLYKMDETINNFFLIN